jgi:TRAP-type C4-dicarboxylate transport system permease small subunit
MKKLIALLSITSYLSIVPAALADTGISACTEGQFHVLCDLQAGNFGGVVGSAVQLIFAIAVVAALFYLIYGGFRWMISTGDKGKVTEAREHIIAAIIGLVVIFLSYFILNIILGFFGVGSLSHINIPSVTLQSPGQ